MEMQQHKKATWPCDNFSRPLQSINDLQFAVKFILSCDP
jgi:hypothetical protein